MAPIVLKTLDMPTAAIQGVMAKTKMVLIVLRTKVRPTKASPMIYTRTDRDQYTSLAQNITDSRDLTSLYASVM